MHSFGWPSQLRFSLPRRLSLRKVAGAPFPCGARLALRGAFASQAKARAMTKGDPDG